MPDAIQSQVRALLQSARRDARSKEMACDTATYDEVIDRVELLLLDLVRERGDLAYAILVLALGSMRLQQLSVLTETFEEDGMNAFIWQAARKTIETGRDIPTMIKALNDALDERNRPKPPPEVR